MALHPKSPPGLPIGPEFPWLAPLAGHTDLSFRLLCREQGAAVACTEMVSTKGLAFHSSGTEDLLATWPPLTDIKAKQPFAAAGAPPALPSDTPLVVQLFGAEEKYMREGVLHLQECGFSWFDCNMGCAVPKVTKTGAGVALMRDPQNAIRIAQALAKSAGEQRAGIKMRLGWDAQNKNFLELAKAFEQAGIGWISLHPRTATEKFSGTALWDAIAQLVHTVSIPVIASGDLFTAHDGLRCLEHTGAAAVMYARGAIANPRIFSQHQHLLATAAKQDYQTSKQELRHLVLRHATITRFIYSGIHPKKNLPYALIKMRNTVPRYIKEISGAKHLRSQLQACENWESFYTAIDHYFTQS